MLKMSENILETLKICNVKKSTLVETNASSIGRQDLLVFQEERGRVNGRYARH